MILLIDLNKLYDEFFKQKKKEPELNIFHPSGLGGTKCIRKLYYNQILAQEHDIDTLKIFEMGNVIHRWVLDFLKWCENNGGTFKLLNTEMPFSILIDRNKDFWINGRLDHFIEFEDKERAVVEVKSIKSLAFLDKPLDHHIEQATLYMWGSRTKKAIIIYVEKNTLQMKWFPIDFDKKLCNEIIDKILLTIGYLENKELPLKIISDWECKYCPYSNKECTNNFNPLKSVSENNVQK